MMDTQATKSPIILTTGIYDLLKEQIRKKKLNKSNEEKLENELKHSKQVLSRDLPIDVVTVNTLVRVKDLSTGEEIEQRFVSPQKARIKNGTTSILSNIGVATLGYATNDIISWELPEGLKSLKILSVEKLS